MAIVAQEVAAPINPQGFEEVLQETTGAGALAVPSRSGRVKAEIDSKIIFWDKICLVSSYRLRTSWPR